METEEPSGRRPTPEEARAALLAVQSAQTDAAAALRPPWWYFASLAALVAVSPLATRLPSTVAGITAFIVFMLLWLTAFGMTLRLFISRAGLVPRFSREQARGCGWA